VFEGLIYSLLPFWIPIPCTICLACSNPRYFYFHFLIFPFNSVLQGALVGGKKGKDNLFFSSPNLLYTALFVSFYQFGSKVNRKDLDVVYPGALSSLCNSSVWL